MPKPIQRSAIVLPTDKNKDDKVQSIIAETMAFSQSATYNGNLYQSYFASFGATEEALFAAIVARQADNGAILQSTNLYVYCTNNPVMYVDPWGLEEEEVEQKSVNYIFYTTAKDSDFTDQATWQAKQLKEQGEIVIMIPVEDIDDFETGWNDMGTYNGENVNINSVYIYSHGNNTTLIFEEGSYTNAMSISGKNSLGNEIGNIKGLQEKNVKKLYLFSCNAGLLAAYEKEGENLASVFSTKINGGIVHAYDGNVGFGDRSILAPFRTEFYARLSVDQEAYYNLMKKFCGASINMNAYKPHGRVRYRYGMRYVSGGEAANLIWEKNS